MILIGGGPEQKAGTSHCIARTIVNGKPYLIDSDDYWTQPCTPENLRTKLPNLFFLYSIEKRKNNK